MNTEATDTHVREPDRPRRTGRLRFAGRLVAIGVAVLFIGLLVYGVIARSPDTTIDDHLARHETIGAPPFELAVLQHGRLGPRLESALAPALADGRLSLRELRGTPAVLNFWASWCIPCREEAPLLERTWARLARPRGVLFLGLDMQDVTSDAHDFLSQFHVSYLNIRDPSNPVARRYGVTGVPETFFISPAGRIVGHVIGVTSAGQLRSGIAAAISGRAVGARRGGDQGAIR